MDHKDRKITQILGMEPRLSEQPDTALSGDEHRRAAHISSKKKISNIDISGVLDARFG